MRADTQKANDIAAVFGRFALAMAAPVTVERVKAAPSPKLAALRVAFDSGLDFSEALKAAGILPGATQEAVEVIRLRLWRVWAARAA